MLLIAGCLAGPLVLGWARRRSWFTADRLRLRFSAGMWALTGAGLLDLKAIGGAGLAAVGTGAPLWTSAVRGVALGLAGLGLAGGVLALSRRGAPSAASREAVAKLAALPLWARLSTLVTVAATEEILFRVAPIDAAALGGVSVPLVAALSLLAFIVAHFAWGRAHLVFVAIVGGFLTGGFLLFRDGWANIIAHALIDTPPLLFAGAMLRGMSARSTASGRAPT